MRFYKQDLGNTLWSCSPNKSHSFSLKPRKLWRKLSLSKKCYQVVNIQEEDLRRMRICFTRYNRENLTFSCFRPNIILSSFIEVKDTYSTNFRVKWVVENIYEQTRSRFTASGYIAYTIQLSIIKNQTQFKNIYFHMTKEKLDGNCPCIM